ncbi:MAG: hypothetical protein Q9226_000480 [Calogaya cf. arnoldii]
MFLTKVFLSLFAAWTSVANAAAVPAAVASPTDKALIFERPFPGNSTLEARSSSDNHTLSERQTPAEVNPKDILSECLGGKPSRSPGPAEDKRKFSTSDMTALARSLSTVNTDAPVDVYGMLRMGENNVFSWGSASVCAFRGDYTRLEQYSWTTTISRNDLGWAIYKIKTKCCYKDNDECFGGRQNVLARDGAVVTVVIGPQRRNGCDVEFPN